MPLTPPAPGATTAGPAGPLGDAPGGEGTLIAIDPTDPNTIYRLGLLRTGCSGPNTRTATWTKMTTYPKAAEGEPELPRPMAGRRPLAPQPSDRLHGFQYLFRSDEEGRILGKNQPRLDAITIPKGQGRLPYLIPYHSITAIAESPFKFGVIYAGTDDGRVHLTKDGGANWTDITAGIPYNKHVWTMVASKYDPAASTSP